MLNFSIGTQVKKEINEFRTKRVRLASREQNDSVRFLNKNPAGYYFNQGDTLALIDMYYNSIFENGPRDKLGQRKIFMNIGKFRCEVASKQIDLDVKNFRFIPDEYADPWPAFFMQKDFKEWTKESTLGELVNDCVDAFPKYGSVVLKKVQADIAFLPLQNLINEMTAASLQSASYVIEQHPDMRAWEIDAMPLWDSEDLNLRFDESLTVNERYGFVPLRWLKMQQNNRVENGDENEFKDAMVIMGFTTNMNKPSEDGVHIFYANEVTERPYREAHWTKQHGRWLGIGTMEDLIENQEAKNIIVNLIRRSLHWSSKRVLQSQNSDAAAKNLVKDVADGEILDVGANGQVTQVDLQSRSNGQFQQFLNEWEKNSDQKAFTYEVATGESMPSGTPFRLGVVLSNAVNSFFKYKQEKLGLLLKHAVWDFKVPQFIKDMSNEDRVVSMFSDEPGFETLKAGQIEMVKAEATRISLLTGKAVDPQFLIEAITPFERAKVLNSGVAKDYYKNAKVKFDLDLTGESNDVEGKLETLKNLYQIMAQQGDPRAGKVLERISALAGESITAFGPAPEARPAAPVAAAPQPNAQPQPVAA